MFFCFLIGVPVAYSLALAAIAGAFSIGIPLEAVMLKISDGDQRVFAMLTIPFFVLAGAIMAEGGMAAAWSPSPTYWSASRGCAAGSRWSTCWPPTFFSGISGSSVADTSAVGSVMIPQMDKSGFPRVFATNVTITGSVQALLLPPSHNAVIYSLATGGTISIISCLWRASCPACCSAFRSSFWCGHRLPRPPSARTDCPSAQAVKITIDAAWGLITLVIILGGILGGVFTRGRGRRRRLRVGVPRHHVHLSRLPVARPARAPDRTVAHGGDGHDPDRFSPPAFGYVMALMQIPAKITAFFLPISSDK